MTPFGIHLSLTIWRRAKTPPGNFNLILDSVFFLHFCRFPKKLGGAHRRIPKIVREKGRRIPGAYQQRVYEVGAHLADTRAYLAHTAFFSNLVVFLTVLSFLAGARVRRLEVGPPKKDLGAYPAHTKTSSFSPHVSRGRRGGQFDRYLRYFRPSMWPRGGWWDCAPRRPSWPS